MKKFLGLMVAVSLSACAHLNSVSQTQIPANRSNKISAETDRWIILFLNFDNDYVDQLSDKLKRECSGGRVTGILTKDETYNYFLGFVMKRRVSAVGFCDKAGHQEASL